LANPQPQSSTADDPASQPIIYDEFGDPLPGWEIDPNTNEPVYVGEGPGQEEPEPVEEAEEEDQEDLNALDLIGNTVLAAADYTKKLLAQSQATLDAQSKSINNSEWRVKLSLAPGADYLYRSGAPGILSPLAGTDGVIFPYTPEIDTQYRANYDSANLTHSNYRGYFYQSSFTDQVNIMADFTAQDTDEAEYMLATIHFFRSATKMFYGLDAERGAPPPLVFLKGLGDYQFNNHPCLITNFSYRLPPDVNYIRALSRNIPGGVDMLSRRNRTVTPQGLFASAVSRLFSIGLQKGAEPETSAAPAPPRLGLDQPTYVPTKMQMQITLLPVQTRKQVSKQFSLKDYSNGNLLRGGFW